ncbi:MAG: TIM barrel protein [Chloroflexota bacterium]
MPGFKFDRYGHLGEYGSPNLRPILPCLAFADSLSQRPLVRFHPNTSILYPDISFREGLERTAAAGFGSCEFWWPLGEELDAVVAALQDTGLSVELFNFYAGNLAQGDRGFLSDPDRQELFRQNVPMALDLARRVGATKINALVGHRLPSLPMEQQIALARENIRWSADQAAQIGATILIEAVNTFENGPYLLPTTVEVARFIASVDRPNVKIQYDVYHMQRMEGNLVSTLQAHISKIGHIQIADSPDRSQPGTGEINFPFVLSTVARLDYAGSIGLEYRPLHASTEESMEWLPKHLRAGSPSVDELLL